MTHPFAESVLSAIKPVIKADEVTLELYGYAQPRVDMDASIARFTEAYCAKSKELRGDWYTPSESEIDAARDHFGYLDDCLGAI